MKRKREKVPEFDEIIFENRNKNYGAYDLRKSYNSATGISILGGIAFTALLTLAITFTTEEGIATTGPRTVTIEISEPILSQEIPQPQIEPPPELTSAIKNLQPVVTTDSSQITSYIPITEEIIETTENRNVNDTLLFSEVTNPTIPTEPKPVLIVEEMPAFPGGEIALLKFVSENIDYPFEARNNNIQGRVILKFVVNTDGSADRIEVLRGIDPSLDNEAMRVVRILPKFKPGKQGGVPVPVWFTLPVLFKLEESDF